MEIYFLKVATALWFWDAFPGVQRCCLLECISICIDGINNLRQR
jgi:hypothetical protein